MPAEPDFAPSGSDPIFSALLTCALGVPRGEPKSGSARGNDSCTQVYRTLAKAAAEALGVRYAVLAAFDPEKAVARSLAFWRAGNTGSSGEFIDGGEWKVAGTPCELVLAPRAAAGAPTAGSREHFCLHAEGLQRKFPADRALANLGAESYLGIPLVAAAIERSAAEGESTLLGHLFVMDTRPMASDPSARALGLLRVLADRAATELSRLRLEEQLRQSEERFRDLFEEAPIAYVHEGLDTRFLRANRAALCALELDASEVPKTFGRDFVVENPDNQRRLREAFESVGRGTDTCGVVLELRRKKSGNPLWIQWWSRPDPDGKTTRTMFIDITEKVLMEQEQAKLKARNTLLEEEVRSAHNHGEIVGEGDALRGVLDAVSRVAATDSTVLIQGETGTGKELVARAIHEGSARRGKPFVKVNCAALPAGLVESEFFGHEKGAFTGAVASRRGRFELADGGTIFLDEVGEVSPEVQVKLLRVLQESEFERVGGSQTIKVNVRVIAATNRVLSHEVQAGKFRADLFYRLSVFPISVPPLRERDSDIPLLASYFATHLGTAMGKRVDGFAPGTLERLMRYAWPGNIRELRNVIERALILGGAGGMLAIADAELAGAAVPENGAHRHAAPADRGEGLGPSNRSQPLTLEDAERKHITEVLAQTGGVVGGPSGAAKILGVPASTLRSRMLRLGVKGR